MTEERNPDEQVEDLDVPEEESEDVKGGLIAKLGGANISHEGFKISAIDPSGFKFNK